MGSCILLTAIATMCLTTLASATSNVLVIGDSMGDYSCGNPEGLGGSSFLTSFCGGARTTNVAVTGSTAWQWRSGGEHADVVASGLQAAGPGLTHIWISLGGNDFLSPDVDAGAPGASASACGISKADLVTRIQAAVDATITAATNGGTADENTKILLLGYCQPAVPQCPDDNMDFSPLSQAFQEVAAATNQVEFYDSTTRCGGVPSDASHFVSDGLHLNRKGYCAVFTDTAVQNALGCVTATYDCSSSHGTCSGDSGGGQATAGGAPPEAHTFPVKSANLENAPAVLFYKLNGDVSASLGTVTDLHAVHGIQTADGGYIMCGKGLEAEESSLTESFCIKYNNAGGTSWAWTSGNAGKKDAANAVMSISSTEAVVVGWKEITANNGRRYITKLNIADGTEVWTGSDFGDTADTTSFYEMIDVNGDSVYLAGGYNKASTAEMSFKSYGNVAGGTAIVQKMPLSALMGTSAPTAASVSWTSTFAPLLTAKAARPVADGKLAALLYGEESNLHATVVMLQEADGSVVWGPTNYDDQGEGTDIQASLDGASVVIAGQGQAPAVSGSSSVPSLYGQLTKVAVSDGTAAWTKSYSSCGVGTNACNKELILNECWGAVATPDGGYALACGTGIEECPSSLTGSNIADCANGEGDKRPGAYKRPAGVWQSEVIHTDADGNMQWIRVDSHRSADSPALGADGWVPMSSAAEWIVNTAEGGLAIITDQVSGTGLLKLGGSETDATENPGDTSDTGTGGTNTTTDGTGGGGGETGSDGGDGGSGTTSEPEWSWVAAAQLCAGTISNCKDADECTTTAYGPCEGGIPPTTYIQTRFAGLLFVDEDKYLACADPAACVDMTVVAASGSGYRDTATDQDGPQENSKYFYTMTGNVFGDLSTSGVYNGIASYLNTGPVDIETPANSLYMATASSTARVNRVADGGSPIGAPIGPFDACITDFNSAGDCNNDNPRTFKPSEFKFSVFGYAAGDDYNDAVVAGQNGFPAGMDRLGVRMEFKVFGIADVEVNGREYEPDLVNEDVTELDFWGDTGGIHIDFPSTYNLGTMYGLFVEMGVSKPIRIKVHSVSREGDGEEDDDDNGDDDEDNYEYDYDDGDEDYDDDETKEQKEKKLNKAETTTTMYVDYLFDTSDIQQGKLFIYDPTVTKLAPRSSYPDEGGSAAEHWSLTSLAASLALSVATS